MLEWDDAKFELEPLIGSQPPADPDLGSIESVLLDGFRMQDELGRLKLERPVRKVEVVTEALRNLQSLTENQKKLLVRARRHGDIDSLLDIEDLPDLEIYETVIELIDSGYLKGVEE